jgi:aminomethyltransferase
MNVASDPKKTIFHDVHVSLGAKMAPFGGYIMPIQYEGIIKEHQAARNDAVIFDTCHMGEFMVTGGTACADIEALVTCDVAGLEPGQCRYGLMCNEAGGVIDDLLVYRLVPEEFMIVVNAGTKDHDFEWIKSHISAKTSLVNLSYMTAKMDLQGPRSPRIMQKLMSEPISGMRYYHSGRNSYKRHKVLISRTGYTGEIGFEIYCDHATALEFWSDCLELGAAPAGLGARDTLRLEMAMPLYGHELDEKRNAAESGFAKAISRNKRFTGSGIVLDEARTKFRLVGIEMAGRRAARNGDKIADGSGVEMGIVTSGSFAPSLEKAVALGYVRKEASGVGTKVSVSSARQSIEGVVVATPFYRNGTARKPITAFLG